MDIEQKVNELICKYNIDKHMPGFRTYVRALELADKEYTRLLQTYDKVVIVGSAEIDLKWFQRTLGKNRSEEWLIDIDRENDIQGRYKQENVAFLVISYYWKDEILVKLLDCNLIASALYDIFEVNGLYFDNNFYDIYARGYHNYRTKKKTINMEDFDINGIFFYHRRRYELEQNDSVKKYYLEKIIFDCIFAKDFISLKKYIDIYTSKYDGAETQSNYCLFYQEISALLHEIKAALKKRNKKDCIMVWLDALEFGEDSDMHFLKGLDEKSLCFNQIYTVTPYTGPTFKTLFAKSRTIEEDSYKIEKVGIENSNLISELKKRNYKFQYHGELNLTAPENTPSYFYNIYSPFTQIYWNILRDILMENENISYFSVLHEVLHTHIPYISFGITGKDYSYSEEWPGQQEEKEQMQRRRQVLESREYVDKQLEFWAELLPEQMYKIYMSDHGHTFFGRFHAIMKIQQEDIKPQLCNQVISYYNFDKLMIQVLDNHKIEESTLGNGYAIVQDVDYYNKALILEVIKQNNFFPDNLVGYQGIVTDEDIFLLYNNGVEYYQKHRNDGNMVSDARLDYLRSKLSKKRIDIEKEDKFQYSRLIWHAIKKCEYRTKDETEKKLRILRQIFQSIPAEASLAVRGGGIHTVRLLMLLDENCRKKVRYIIDRDCECYGGKMGIKVVTLDEIEKYKIDYIVISSYDYREIWKNELKGKMDVQIIDLYEILETKGIVCTKEFYKNNYIKEDFET